MTAIDGERGGDAVEQSLAVCIRDLTKVYQPSPRWLRFLLRSAISSPVTALDGVCLDVARGETCAIVGVNGAGKSTLFRVLTGLTTPTSGTAAVYGVDASRAPRAVRALLGFVPAGDQSLYLRMTCRDNLVFDAQLCGLSGHALNQRVSNVLETVGLGYAANRVGFALSAGMRARLQLARALLHDPRVLILDEPTATVDPVGAYEILDVIQQLAAEQGVAVLLSSHRLEEIEALGRRVVLMDRGKIIYDGNLDALARQVPQRTIVLRYESVEARVCGAKLLALRFETKVMEDDDLAATTVSLITDLPVASLITNLGDAAAGITGIEEAKAPLREVIYSALQRRPFRDVE